MAKKATAEGVQQASSETQTPSVVRKATTADVLGGLFRPAKKEDRKGGEQIPKTGYVLQQYIVG